MNDYHKNEFEQLMIICFKNFGKIPDISLIDMFFERLKSFNIEYVRKAFGAYIEERDKRSGAPCLKDLIMLAKKSAASAYAQVRETCAKRCYVQGCNSPDDQILPCDYAPDIFICRHHLDEFVLATMPDSNHARLIREDKKFRAEAERLRRTLREHIEVVLDERILKGIERTKNEERQRVILKEERPKSAAEIFYESTSKPIANYDEIMEYDIPF